MAEIVGAHLVGSVPLADAETVLRTLARALGRHLARMPDGETGTRTNWIAWQYPVLAGTPGLEPIPVGDRGYLRRQLVRLAGDRTAPRFGALGYADAAIASYAIFERLQREGVLARDVRFQVSLPTPLAPITVFVAPEDRAIVEPAYEARMHEELATITRAIPHDRLAIQWDVAAELGLVEGVWPAHFARDREGIEAGVVERLARLSAAVPRDVSLGVHLCYGDFGHEHFVQPADASTLVRLANALARASRLDFVHAPVPLAWTAKESFAPLAALALAPETRLFLGVVHHADGVDGAKRRIELASSFVPRFGVATECGLGRRPPDTIEPLLAQHAAIAAAVR